MTERIQRYMATHPEEDFKTVTEFVKDTIRRRLQEEEGFRFPSPPKRRAAPGARPPDVDQ